MSSNFDNTAKISADGGFRARVLAAIVEHGSQAVLATGTDFLTDTTNHALARAILWDPTQYQALFSALVADDATISTQTDPASVTDDQIRAVVSAIWTNVGAIVPNLR